MKKLIVLTALLLLAVFALSSCGGGTSVDTDENAALALKSSLAGVLDRPLQEYNYTTAIPEEPWIILRKNFKDEWRVIGCSLEELNADTLSQIRTVIRCDNDYISEGYTLAGSKAVAGTSEYVKLYYFDARRNDFYGLVHIPPRELPRSAVNVPDYRISDGKVLDTVQKRFKLGIAAADMPEDLRINGTVLEQYENKRLTAEHYYDNRADESRFEKPFYVPRSITEIGLMAFQKTRFSQIVLGENVKKLGKYAFEDSTAITEMDLSSVEDVGWYAFSGCENLEKVTFGDCTAVIGYGAFSRCSSLREIDLTPVRQLGDTAFTNCTGLEKAVLSDSEEIIEHIHGCFNNCPALREVIVPEGNPAMMSRNGAVYSKDGHTLLLFPENNGMLLQEALEGVDTLGRNAFKRCGSSLGLTDGKLTLDSLKAIGKYAFEYYEGVRELNLGGEVTETQGVFRNCPNLERVVITAPLKRLGEASFSKCPNLREIVLPDTLETIEACLSECPLLEELHIPASVQSISDSFLSKSPDTTTLVVTPGSYAEQFAAEHNLKYRSE